MIGIVAFSTAWMWDLPSLLLMGIVDGFDDSQSKKERYKEELDGQLEKCKILQVR